MAPDSTVDLIFVDEPPPAQPRGNRSPVNGWLQSLREHPGKWAKYPTPFMSNFDTRKINSGGGYGVVAGEFEAVTRGIANKRYELYARYIGAPEDGAPPARAKK